MNLKNSILGGIFLLLTTLLPFFSFAETPEVIIPPVEKVERQLATAEAEFDLARKMFNPWYAGPLLTPGAHNAAPGHFAIQGYLYFTTTFAKYNDHRDAKSIPNIFAFKPAFVYQMGLFTWLDFTVVLQATYNSQKKQHYFDINDTSISFGIPLMTETPYNPAVRFVISETFPTGKYQHLNPKKNGLDATGIGSYQTGISLNVSKVVWWMLTHPMAFRGSINYTIPSDVHVSGFNAFGGGHRTRGTVDPGNSVSVDVAGEYSFTQNWVIACDLAYTYQQHSSFSGRRCGAIVGVPSNDQLSLAPAIEYNPSANLNFLLGLWFTITGRNSSDFVSAVLSAAYSW